MSNATRPLARTLGEPQKIQGITLDAGTDVYFGLDDQLVLCVLQRDQDILGVPCAKGLVHFHPDGKLAQATLSRAFEHRGVSFSRHTQLSWNDDGLLVAHIGSSHTIGDVDIPGAASARLCPEGQLISWSRRVDSAEVVGTIPCQVGSIVSLFPDGQPERLTVAQDHPIGDLVAMAGTDVEFHRTGQVSVITLAQASTQAGMPFDAGTNLVFRDDGTLSVAHLAADFEHDGATYDAGTYLLFDAKQQMTGDAAITWGVTTPGQS